MDLNEGLRNRPNASNSYTNMEETESVEELRQRLHQMKAMVNDRGSGIKKKTGLSEGFMNMVFGSIIILILSVTVYSFYNLFAAVYTTWYPSNPKGTK